MKILWHSNAPFTPTGYGNQTALFAPRLQALGHEVIVSAYYGLDGATMNIDGVQIVPKFADSYGNDMLLFYKDFYDPDIVIGLTDQWVVDPRIIERLGNYIAWTPVDHDPAPPAVVANVNRAFKVVAYSKFGQDRLQQAGVRCDYIPHGVDTKAYKPMDKREARETLGLPTDKFIVGMVMANKGFPPRKAWDQQINAFAEFHKSHPDSFLYLHTHAEGYQGVDLKRIMELADLPKDAARFCAQGPYKAGMYSTEHMVTTFNAFDVLLNATRGEGFGLPIVEAQACGVPVIVTNFTAMRELLFWGDHVPPAARVLTQQDSYHAIPDQTALVMKLRAAYQRTEETGGHKSIPPQVAGYDADYVTQHYWEPYLEGVAQEIDRERQRREPVVIPSRIQRPKVSVLMPAYNAKETIDRAIESVMVQNVPLELLIYDDASTDGTWKHTRKWRQSERVSMIRGKSGVGPVGALNALQEKAQGDYIIKLDADDWFPDGALAILAGFLDDNPEIGFVYGVCQYHGKTTLRYVPPVFDADEFWTRNVAQGEVMYRREAIDKGVKMRGFWKTEDGREFGPHDWDHVLQMIHDLGWRGRALAGQVTHNYTHSDNGWSSETKKRNGEVIKRLREQWPQLRASAI